MKRYMRIVIYSIVGAMVLMLYLMLVTLSDSMEQVIHRKGRFINREVEETMLEETESEMSEEAKLEILVMSTILGYYLQCFIYWCFFSF